MTYDQLLNKINILGDTTTHFALKAVVELHKPSTDREFTNNSCAACQHGFPCTTILAIIKEIEW